MNKRKTEMMMYPASRGFPCMAFSVYEVVRVAYQSRSWFVLYTPCSQGNDDVDDDDDDDVCNDDDEQEDNKNNDDDENGDNDDDDNDGDNVTWDQAQF